MIVLMIKIPISIFDKVYQRSYLGCILASSKSKSLILEGSISSSSPNLLEFLFFKSFNTGFK